MYLFKIVPKTRLVTKTDVNIIKIETIERKIAHNNSATNVKLQHQAKDGIKVEISQLEKATRLVTKVLLRVPYSTTIGFVLRTWVQ